MEKQTTDKSKTRYPWLQKGFRPEFVSPNHPNNNRNFFIIILCFIIYCIILFFILLYGGKNLVSFIIAISIIFFYAFIILFYDGPLLCTLFLIAFRTRNRDFILQFVYYTLSRSIFYYLPFFPIIFTFTNWGEFFIILVILIIPVFLVILISMMIRQPLLFQDSAMWKNVSETKSTILSSSALEMDFIEDGYSQRAFFSEFDVLSDLITSSEEFNPLLTDYAKFLVKKGVLIDWEITDKSMKLFPRFLIHSRFHFKNPLKTYQLLQNIRKRENLTVVEITYNSPQISIHVAPHDYEILAREVTFHLLCINVLNKMKQSLLAFLHNDHDVAFDILFRKPS